MAMLLNVMYAAALPSTPIAVLSLFYPTVHISEFATQTKPPPPRHAVCAITTTPTPSVFVGRAIELAEADLQVRKRRMADKAKARKASVRTQMALTGKVDDALPLWKGARFVVRRGRRTRG